jgi:hypothetical protein
MKKILKIASAIAMISAFSANAGAASSNAVFGGYSFGEDNQFAYLGGVTALNDNIDSDGFLLRSAVGYGKYNYATQAVANNHVNGDVSAVDLMLGYQKFSGQSSVALYVGGNYDDYDLDQNDPYNSVSDGKFGGKAQLEFSLALAQNIRLTNVSNYTSVFNAYYTQSDLSYNFGSFAFGPQAIFLGNKEFDQQRFGATISQIDFKYFIAYISGGYLKSAGLAGDDGAYTAIGFSTKF